MVADEHTLIDLDEIAEHVVNAPRLRVTDRAQTHVQRASWARRAQHTPSQAQRLTDTEAREAVALAVLARVWPSDWTSAELAQHTGLDVEQVDDALTAWEREGVITRHSGGLDLTTPTLLQRLGVSL